MNKRRTISFVTTGLLLLAIVGGFVFRQDLRDWWRLRGYTPPAEIARLATETTMYGDSQRLFYVQHPLLADKTTFNEFCRNNEQTIVLGCYVHGQGIYLLDVTDERISGVEEVTAAHELLHAAYERLSRSDKARIDKLLADTYDSITNERLRQTVEQYREQDPSVVPNELHSILGTEVRTLPNELEAYYRRYFTNRQAIVTFSEQYEQAFIERRNAIRAYDEQLAVLKDEISTLQADLEQQESALRTQRNQMNQQRSSGEISAYNAQVPVYNQKVNRYNSDVAELEDMVNEYNDIVQRRNDVAAEEADLVEAIDSREVVPEQQ